jgi:hypothetical protein
VSNLLAAASRHGCRACLSAARHHVFSGLTHQMRLEACMDIGTHLGHDHSVTGRVEEAVRAAVSPGDRLAISSERGHFIVTRYTTDGLVRLWASRGEPSESKGLWGFCGARRGADGLGDCVGRGIWGNRPATSSHRVGPGVVTQGEKASSARSARSA